jgi:nicotinate-nucleotide adenylyltransferase
MNNIGLYFGSFNPIHIGHLLIASHIASSKLVDKIWFVVSPQNPLKPSNSLLNEYDRLHLVNLSIEGDLRFAVSNIEFSLPKPSYTIDTLTYLAEKYPKNSFSLIMGSDSFNNLPKWKNYAQIIDNHRIIIYPRPGFDADIRKAPNAQIVKAPYLDISSTSIRQHIKLGKTIRYMVTEGARIEIEENGYYK